MDLFFDPKELVMLRDGKVDHTLTDLMSMKSDKEFEGTLEFFMACGSKLFTTFQTRAMSGFRSRWNKKGWPHR
jgi:hypothetical protein